MSKQEKKGLVPELRFPEFRGKWSETKLGELGKFTGGGTPSKSEDSYWKGNIPWVSSSDIIENSIHSLKTSRFITNEAIRNSATKRVPPNSILLVSRVGVGKLAITNDSVCTSQDFTNFTPAKDNLLFLGYYLKSRSKDLLEYSQGMAIKGFTKGDISKLRVAIPSPNEQQKIAGCLTSIDELITTQTQKVDALKAHKKGLMQQLFPAEGETVPKLRFPEFRDKGEWSLKTLDDISSVGSGGTPSRAKPEYWNGNIPWISTTLIAFNTIEEVNEHITDLGLQNSSAKIFPKGTILMAMYGQGKTRGQVALLGMSASINQACAAITLDKEMNTEFVFQNLASRYEEIRRISNQGGQDNLSAALIKTIPIAYPDAKSGEQKKIADCLTSIDVLIISQTKKLDILKAHKEGLMQKLFPFADY